MSGQDIMTRAYHELVAANKALIRAENTLIQAISACNAAKTRKARAQDHVVELYDNAGPPTFDEREGLEKEA